MVTANEKSKVNLVNILTVVTASAALVVLQFITIFSVPIRHLLK